MEQLKAGQEVVADLERLDFRPRYVKSSLPAYLTCI